MRNKDALVPCQTIRCLFLLRFTSADKNHSRNKTGNETGMIMRHVRVDGFL